jgi:hypothetical protein
LKSLSHAHGNTGELKSTIFDWNIVTPDATSKVLKAISDKTYIELLANKENFCIKNSRLAWTAFPGFFFWHEDAHLIMESDQAFKQFVKKQMHMINNMINRSGSSVGCIWSNIQPNLFSATLSVSASWSDFELSFERAENIKNNAMVLFGPKTRIIYVTRQEDVKNGVGNFFDLEVLELPRGRDFRGEPGLFNPAFMRLGLKI